MLRRTDLAPLPPPLLLLLLLLLLAALVASAAATTCDVGGSLFGCPYDAGECCPGIEFCCDKSNGWSCVAGKALCYRAALVSTNLPTGGPKDDETLKPPSMDTGGDKKELPIPKRQETDNATPASQEVQTPATTNVVSAPLAFPQKKYPSKITRSMNYPSRMTQYIGRHGRGRGMSDDLARAWFEAERAGRGLPSKFPAKVLYDELPALSADNRGGAIQKPVAPPKPPTVAPVKSDGSFEPAMTSTQLTKETKDTKRINAPAPRSSADSVNKGVQSSNPGGVSNEQLKQLLDSTTPAGAGQAGDTDNSDSKDGTGDDPGGEQPRVSPLKPRLIIMKNENDMIDGVPVNEQAVQTS